MCPLFGGSTIMQRSHCSNNTYFLWWYVSLTVVNVVIVIYLANQRDYSLQGSKALMIQENMSFGQGYPLF